MSQATGPSLAIPVSACAAKAFGRQAVIKPAQADRGEGPKADVLVREAKRLGREAAKRERLARRERDKLVSAVPSGWLRLCIVFP